MSLPIFMCVCVCVSHVDKAIREKKIIVNVEWHLVDEDEVGEGVVLTVALTLDVLFFFIFFIKLTAHFAIRHRATPLAQTRTAHHSQSVTKPQ